MSCGHLDSCISVDKVADALSKILVLQKTGGVSASSRHAAICLSCSGLVQLRCNGQESAGTAQLKECGASNHCLFMRLHSPYEVFCADCGDFQYSSKLDDIMANLASMFSDGSCVSPSGADADSAVSTDSGTLSNRNISSVASTPGLRGQDSGSSLSSLGDNNVGAALRGPVALTHYDELRAATEGYKLVTHGFYNMGATCFLSSVVQSLLHNPLLQLYFIRQKSIYYKCARCSTEWSSAAAMKIGGAVSGSNGNGSASSATCIACNMKKLFCLNDMHSQLQYLNSPCTNEVTRGKGGSSNGNGSGGAHKALSKYATVPSDLLFGIWKQCDYMVGYAQQDAHEFMIALLDSWENEVEPLGVMSAGGRDAPRSPSPPPGSLKRKAGGSPAPSVVEVKVPLADSSMPAVPQPANILRACFNGTMCSTLTCSNCAYKSVKDEPFVDLSLSLQQRATQRNNGEVLYIRENSTLLQCLQEYHSAELLVDPILCSNCNLKQVCEKQLSIRTPPCTLVIQLKRFDAMRQKKVSASILRCCMYLLSHSSSVIVYCVHYQIAGNVHFPLEGLDISSLLTSGGSGGIAGDGHSPPLAPKRSAVYDLSTVICHSGTLDVGHYVAYLRRLVARDDGSTANSLAFSQEGGSPTPVCAGGSVELSGEVSYEWIRFVDAPWRYNAVCV
jgi:ubiquitin C-terminal hydrolase